MQAAHDPGNHDAEAEAGPGDPDSDMQLRGRMWELARAAVELRCRRLEVPGFGEAAAALQELALGLAVVDPSARKRSVWPS